MGSGVDLNFWLRDLSNLVTRRAENGFTFLGYREVIDTLQAWTQRPCAHEARPPIQVLRQYHSYDPSKQDFVS